MFDNQPLMHNCFAQQFRKRAMQPSTEYGVGALFSLCKNNKLHCKTKKKARAQWWRRWWCHFSSGLTIIQNLSRIRKELRLHGAFLIIENECRQAQRLLGSLRKKRQEKKEQEKKGSQPTLDLHPPLDEGWTRTNERPVASDENDNGYCHI